MRHWNLPDTHNVRDLGGYARRAGGHTQWRRVLRGDSLHHLHETGRDALAEAGLSLVIDLRNSREVAAEPNPFSGHPAVAYANVSLFEALAPITLAAAPFDMGERYRQALAGSGDRMIRVLQLIADAPPGMVLFHCTAGKDRTGLVAAMLLALAEVDATDIVADYTLTAGAGPLLERLRRRSLANGADASQVERVLASDAATMVATLEHLQRVHGGVGTYLRDAGLPDASAHRLVARLCQ